MSLFANEPDEEINATPKESQAPWSVMVPVTSRISVLLGAPSLIMVIIPLWAAVVLSSHVAIKAAIALLSASVSLILVDVMEAKVVLSNLLKPVVGSVRAVLV